MASDYRKVSAISLERLVKKDKYGSFREPFNLARQLMVNGDATEYRNAVRRVLNRETGGTWSTSAETIAD